VVTPKSAAGVSSGEASLGQAEQLLKLCRDKGLSCGQLQRRFDSGLLADLLDPAVPIERVDRDQVRSCLGLPERGSGVKVEVSQPVFVNYGQGHFRHVLSCGLDVGRWLCFFPPRRNIFSEDIERRRSVVKVSLPNRTLSYSDEEVDEMWEQNGWRDATFAEGVTLIRYNPSVLSGSWLVGRGSTWYRYGREHVYCFGQRETKYGLVRRLKLYRRLRYWSSSDRYLVVLKDQD
jgi:hypothetical protein